MRSLIRFLSLVSFIFTTNALAYCDQERREAEEWGNTKIHLVRDGLLTGFIGYIFTIEYANRIAAEKARILRECEARMSEQARREQAEAEQARLEARAREREAELLPQYRAQYEENLRIFREDTTNRYDAMFVTSVEEEVTRQGEAPSEEIANEVIQRIHARRIALEAERDRLIAEREAIFARAMPAAAPMFGNFSIGSGF